MEFSRFHSELELSNELSQYQGYLGLMIRFNPIKLLDEFSEQYVIENGRDKFDKVASLIKSSDEIKTYIDNLKWKVTKPVPKDLQYLICSHRYIYTKKIEQYVGNYFNVVTKWTG